MKYKHTGKHLKVKDVAVYSPASAEEADNFVHNMDVQFDWRLNDWVEFNELFMNYIDNKDCFKDWLVKEGYLEEVKEFEPFTLELEIKSEKQLFDLWHRLNAGGIIFKNYNPSTKHFSSGHPCTNGTGSFDTWNQINKIVKQLYPEVYGDSDTPMEDDNKEDDLPF